MNAYNPAIDIRDPDAPLTADEREAIRVLTTGVHAGEPWQGGYADAIMRRYEATIAALAKRVEELEAQDEKVRGVILRRHERLAAALGDDPGCSVDMTIDKAIARIEALTRDARASTIRVGCARHETTVEGCPYCRRVAKTEAALSALAEPPESEPAYQLDEGSAAITYNATGGMVIDLMVALKESLAKESVCAPAEPTRTGE